MPAPIASAPPRLRRSCRSRPPDPRGSDPRVCSSPLARPRDAINFDPLRTPGGRMTDLNRRRFLLTAAALGGGIFAPSLRGLVAYAAAAEPFTGRRPIAPANAQYGPLRPAGPELALPDGFQYLKLGVEGTPMSDGELTPRAHDGMAAFQLPNGNVRLIRNHEDRSAPANGQLRGPVETAYDRRGGGGTTSLEI